MHIQVHTYIYYLSLYTDRLTFTYISIIWVFSVTFPSWTLICLLNSIHFSSFHQSLIVLFFSWNDQLVPFYKSILAQMEPMRQLLNQHPENLISH